MTTTPSPTRLSPMHGLHVESGAILDGVNGWLLPARYSDVEAEAQAVTKAVGICDVTGRKVVRLKSTQLGDVLAEVPDVGQIARVDDGLVARLAPDEALLIGDVKLADAGTLPRYLIDVTSGFAAIRIAGPRSRDLLSAVSEIDLRDESMPDMACIQAGFAHVHGTLLRVDAADGAAYDLLVAREYGEYIWEALLESLGDGVVIRCGTEALRRLEGGG